MRLRLDATPEELAAKGDAMVRQLAKSLAQASPTLSEALYKAAPPQAEQTDDRMILALQAQAAAVYGHHMTLARKRLVALLAEEADRHGVDLIDDDSQVAKSLTGGERPGHKWVHRFNKGDHYEYQYADGAVHRIFHNGAKHLWHNDGSGTWEHHLGDGGVGKVVGSAPHHYQDDPVRPSVHHVEFRRALTDEQGHAVQAYATESGNYAKSTYAVVNRALRDGTEPPAIVQHLDGAIAATRLKANALVHRGVSGHPHLHVKENDVISDSGYLSTSADAGVAEHFAGFDKRRDPNKVGTVYHLLVPIGHPALPVDELAQKPADEQEFMLPRNTRIQVISAERDPYDDGTSDEGRLHIYGRVLGIDDDGE